MRFSQSTRDKECPAEFNEMHDDSVKFRSRWSIKEIGIFRSFTFMHSYREWTKHHKINSITEIKDIDSLLKETKHIVKKLLDIHMKT